MSEGRRYIVWTEDREDLAGDLILSLLAKFPAIKVLKRKGPDCAVVLMAPEIKERATKQFPRLSIEPDVQHRFATAR